MTRKKRNELAQQALPEALQRANKDRLTELVPGQPEGPVTGTTAAERKRARKAALLARLEAERKAAEAARPPSTVGTNPALRTSDEPSLGGVGGTERRRVRFMPKPSEAAPRSTANGDHYDAC